MRNAFIQELVLAAESSSNVALVVGDLGYKVVEPFADAYPERFFNAGIAEQNMMGLAAGLASEGLHVFVYSIANFPTFRCAEQLRNDVDYHNLPVTVVCAGGGLVYGALGYSHHAIQDYALVRSLPNTLIAAPGDANETRACVRYFLDNPCPSYLRLGKAGEPIFHEDVPAVSPGRWLRVGTQQHNADKVILTTGATLGIASDIIDRLPSNNVGLYSMPIWGMQAKIEQSWQAEPWQQIITLEDHLYDGGFGSWMMEALMHRRELLTKLRIRALDRSVCGLVGTQSTLNMRGGLYDLPDWS